MLHNIVFYDDGDILRHSPIHISEKIDPDCYGYLDMLEVIFSKMNVTFMELEIRVDNGLHINGDDDVKNMFNMYEGVEEIPVFVKGGGARFSCMCTTENPRKVALQVVLNHGIKDHNRSEMVDVTTNKVVKVSAGNAEEFRPENGDGVAKDGRGSEVGRGRVYERGKGMIHRTSHSRRKRDEDFGFGDNYEHDTEGMVMSGEMFELSDDSEDEWLNVKEGSYRQSSSDEENNELEIMLNEDDDKHELSDCGKDSSHDGYETDEKTGRYSKRTTKKFDSNLRTFAKEFKRTEQGKIVFERFHIFRDVYHFREVLRDYSIEEGYELKRIKNESYRVKAKCMNEECSWVIHASRLPDNKTFMIKTLAGEHNCIRPVKNSNANAKWIAEKLDSYVKVDPNMSFNLMSTHLANQYGLEPDKQQLYRARRKARDRNEGNHAESYGKLRNYALLLMETNPGTVVKMEFSPGVDPKAVQPSFKRMFVSFDACIKGFQRGCRQFIGLDGCFLKGPFRGICLVAVTIDGNNGILPLAVAIVETECKDSYMFFMECLQHAIGHGPFTFMSDKQKGLIEAVAQTYPQARHRFCARHLYSNFRAKFGGLALRHDFWKAAKAYNKREFDAVMRSIHDYDKNGHAFKWLNEKPATTWSRIGYDYWCKVENVTNNMTESFNSWIGKIRDKPVLTLLEKIRMKVMTRFAKRYGMGCTWTSKLTPFAIKELDDRIKEARVCNAIPAGNDEFQVFIGLEMEAVNLGTKKCTCNQWTLSGIPCKHVVACLKYKRTNVEDYCDDAYSVQTYLKAYAEIIHPLPEVDLSPANPTEAILPPPLRRLPGRPRKVRRREVGEEASRARSSTVRCGVCNKIGHNQRSCENNPSRPTTGRCRVRRMAGTRVHVDNISKASNRSHLEKRKNVVD